MVKTLAGACLVITLATGVDAELRATGAPLEARARPGASEEIQWVARPDPDAARLEPWRQGVGGPLLRVVPLVPLHDGSAASLEDLVIVSWNVHGGRGDVVRFVEDLTQGRFTNGQRVTRFVLLLQEARREGEDVPPFTPTARSAAAIAHDRTSTDIAESADRMGLSVFYVPSMRNGPLNREDRGNAIISTEALHDPIALELPAGRQRRVAVSGSVKVMVDDREVSLRVMNVHFDPRGTRLGLFGNARGRQMLSVLDHLRGQPDHASGWAGSVLGGDLNTVQGGADETVYREARKWARSLGTQDVRNTHVMGRLDYLFYRLSPGWEGGTVRIGPRYGSDHHPLLGRFVRTGPQP